MDDQDEINCENCGEVRAVYNCKECGTSQNWCLGCEDNVDYLIEYQLCDDCHEKAANEIEKQRCELAEIANIRVKLIENDDLEMLKESAVEDAFIRKAAFVDYDDTASLAKWKPNPARALAAYLRHNATNYDEILKLLPERMKMSPENDVDEAYMIVRKRINEALLNRYPQFRYDLEEVDSSFRW
jgi:hypothetical protein